MSATDEKEKLIETLRRENEMLKHENSQFKSQLQEATDAFKDITAKAKIAEDAERKDLVATLARESENKLSADILDKMTLPELYVAKMTLDKTRAKSFASIIAAQDAESKKPKNQPLTVGEWDPEKKQWSGGV